MCNTYFLLCSKILTGKTEVSRDLAINKAAKSYHLDKISLAALPQIFNFVQAGCIVGSHVKLKQYLHQHSKQSGNEMLFLKITRTT
jgi:hypothetical protein